jgi:hypothetical protein
MHKKVSLQENLDLVALIFPHKMLISAKKCKFPGGNFRQ